jgi:hypothetical protein
VVRSKDGNEKCPCRDSDVELSVSTEVCKISFHRKDTLAFSLYLTNYTYRLRPRLRDSTVPMKCVEGSDISEDEHT